MKSYGIITILLIVMFSFNGHALRIANVPNRITMEIATLEILHDEEDGGGMIIARAQRCDECKSVTLTYDDTVLVTSRGFHHGEVIEYSGVVEGSVTYDPDTLEATVITIYE